VAKFTINGKQVDSAAAPDTLLLWVIRKDLGLTGTKFGCGIAVVKSFESYVAEVSIENGKVRVHRVVCAIDCGVVVNPDIVAAQSESAVVFGLSAALYGNITIENGAVVQGNFDTSPVLRINEMPAVEVHIVPSTEKPTGVGEPGTPPIAPAVVNALYALTGKRLRKLPIAV